MHLKYIPQENTPYYVIESYVTYYFVQNACSTGVLLCEEEEEEEELGRITILPFADISTNIVATFAPFGSHSSLWPKATTFERSQ